MAMVRCIACGYQIPSEALRPGGAVPCPLCHRELKAVVLPAIARSAAAVPPSLPAEPPGPGDAVCFYSPDRKATNTCGHCGVFISEAWTAKWGAETVCLKCLEDLRIRRKDARFEARRTLWDNAALGTALLPFGVCLPLALLGPMGPPFMMIAMMGSVITAPTALALSLFAWKKPRSLVPRGRWRVVGALLLSAVQCLAWAALIVAIASRQLNLFGGPD
jgi:hypothetical protein